MATAETTTTPASSGWPQRRRRLLMFPLPFQGHINPMMQLAGALHARGGLDITVFHAAVNEPDHPARRPAGYRFVPVGEDVPSGDLLPSGSDADFVSAVLRMNERMAGPFRDLLLQELEDAEAGEAPVACLVVDSNLRGMQLVAEELGVPTLVLRTGAAACLVAYMAFPALCNKGLLPPLTQDQSQLNMLLDELSPLRLRDIVFSTATSHANMCRCLECLVECSRYSSGVIINTFLDLEECELQKVPNALNVPTYAIGPLHKISLGAESSLVAQDRTCLEWLDKQEDDSVLYVSFGSLASMKENELLETAWGLANSLRPFLWVVRHNLVQSSQQVSLPDGFEEVTHGRGMIVSWAPQQEVLGHCAVGGFWTHNGWNSTLESICEGVPMICRPQFADQMINMRYVEEVWKIGFELEGELERASINRAIQRLFSKEEGREMRQRAMELSNKAVKSVEELGSSKTSIDLLFKRVMSF